eukprot:11220979-Lingulodinium_polyedra.AAC.1
MQHPAVTSDPSYCWHRGVQKMPRLRAWLMGSCSAARGVDTAPSSSVAQAPPAPSKQSREGQARSAVVELR